MTIFITKFVSQKCFGYAPKADRSLWHMIAEFNDGKVREAYLWLRTGVECTGHEAGWGISPTNNRSNQMTNLPIELVTKGNIDNFLMAENTEIKKYVLGKIEAGQIIIASNCSLGEYVCFCTKSNYAEFQRIGAETKSRVFSIEEIKSAERLAL